MRDIVTKEVESIHAYVPGKPIEEVERELGIVGAVKLASNENPFGPSPKALDAVRREAENVHFYPEGDAPYLKDRLAAHWAVDRDQLVVGNGSNELLELAVRTFTTDHHHAVISRHAFMVYHLVLTTARVPYTACEMTADLRHDLVAMKAAIRENTRLVFIANPNNPTGTVNTIAELETFFDGLREDVIVVLDEAYFEFVGRGDYTGGIRFLEQHPNTLITRTFSKAYGLAGLRIGYGISSPRLAGYLNRIRQPFNTSRVAQAAGTAALDDVEYLAETLEKTRSNRAILSQNLKQRGFVVLPSETNFVLVKTPIPGAELVETLLHMGVIIRAMDSYELPAWVRISVGTTDQQEKLFGALDRAFP